MPRLLGQIRQQFGLLERDIAVRLKLREAHPQEAGDTDVDRIMGGNLPLLVRHARAFGLHRLVSTLSTHGVEAGEAGEAGGGKGGGETMSSMRLSVLAPATYHPIPRYLSPLGVEHAPLPTVTLMYYLLTSLLASPTSYDLLLRCSPRSRRPVPTKGSRRVPTRASRA